MPARASPADPNRLTVGGLASPTSSAYRDASSGAMRVLSALSRGKKIWNTLAERETTQRLLLAALSRRNTLPVERGYVTDRVSIEWVRKLTLFLVFRRHRRRILSNSSAISGEDRSPASTRRVRLGTPSARARSGSSVWRWQSQGSPNPGRQGLNRRGVNGPDVSRPRAPRNRSSLGCIVGSRARLCRSWASSRKWNSSSRTSPSYRM
jgi:hypothetical protein